jgi:autotransporter translocation and assembly factor TamB
VYLQDFADGVPSDIPRINARIHGWMRGAPPFGKEGAVEASFGPTSFRRHAIDTARVEAEWRGRALTIPRLYAAYKGTSLNATGDGVFDSTFQLHAEVHSQDIRELAAQLPIPENLADSLAGAVQLSADTKFKLSAAGLSEFEAKADLEGESVAAGPCSFRRLSVSVNTFRLSPLFAEGSVHAEDGEFAGHALDKVMVRFSGRPDSVATNLSASLAHDSLRLQLEGVFEQHDTGELIANLNMLKGEILGYGWTLENPARLTWNGNELSMTDFDLNSDLGALRAAGRLAVKGEQDFSIFVSDLRSGALTKLLPLPDAKISAQLQLAGTDQAPIVNFELVAESLQWDENGWIDKLIATGMLQRDSLSASGLAIWQRDTLLTFSANAPATLSFSEGLRVPRDRPLTAHLRLHGQPLTKLQPYLPWGVRIGGWAGLDLNISGTMEQPVWNGDLVIENGSIEDIVHGLHYEDIYLKANWRGDSLFIERAEAKATGKVEGQGMALMAFPLPESLAVRVNFKHFQIVNRADLRAKLSGDIALEGPLMALRTQGNLTLDELQYRITSATTKDIELVDLEAKLAELRGDTAIAFRFPGDLIYKKMNEAVRVKLPRNCWIHGGGVSIELEGDVWLYKQPNETEQVYGQIRVVRGTVNLYTRRLEVQEGTITFDGDLQDPNLDITAIEANLKRSRNVEIVLKLGGTKNHPEIQLSGSDPDGDLTYEDIISYLTLGRRATGTTEMYASGATSSDTPMLGTAAVTGVSAGVSSLVSRALRLDVFDYRPGQGGVAGLTQGELEVGAYVTSNLFVSVIHSMEEKQVGQKVILEYQVLPWLRLRGTRQSEGQSGFDLFFQWEWR